MQRGMLFLEAAADFMAGQVGQAIIQQHDIGLQGSRLFLRLRAVASLAHDFDQGIDFFDLVQSLSQGGMIINDQQPDGVLSFHGVFRRLGLRGTSA